MRSSFYDAGMLEIHRFVPPSLLKGMELNDLSLEEFFRCLAMARYVQELEGAILQNAIVRALEGEKE